MKVVIHPDADGASRTAAGIIARLMRRRPACVLGLPTGGTPVRMYRRLVELHREGDLDLHRVTTFVPDEYVGVPLDHPASRHFYMRRNFLDHVDLQPSRVHLPDGNADDLNEMIRHYRRAIELAGGFDLFVLGVGGDGHLASNEPGSSLASRMRVVPLTRARRPYLAEAFGGGRQMPRRAVTLGIADILEARRCLLLAFGESKADVVARIVEGPLTAHVPASALQQHPDATLLIDEAAASRLRDADHWREAYPLPR